MSSHVINLPAVDRPDFFSARATTTLVGRSTALKKFVLSLCGAVETMYLRIPHHCDCDMRGPRQTLRSRGFGRETASHKNKWWTQRRW